MRETTIHYIDVVERKSDSASGHRQCVLGTNIYFDKSAIERATFHALEDQDIDLLVVISSGPKSKDTVITPWKACCCAKPCSEAEETLLSLTPLSSKASTLSGSAPSLLLRQA